MNFQIEIEKEPQSVKMTLRGRLDGQSAPLFQEEIEKIGGEKIETITFYMGDLDYLSSAGIRVLLLAIQKFKTVSFRIVGVKENVREVLTQTGIYHLLKHDEKKKGIKGKIGVLIEEHFDGIEFATFNDFFPHAGYEVEYMSHLWNQPQLRFGSNPENDTIQYHVTVSKEIEKADPKDYLGIILIGAYAMDRLRYEAHPRPGEPNQAPALRFLRRALKTEGLKIGTICHALWLFCADPELLRGKKVTCAHNIISDVQNAGGIIQYAGDALAPICIDGNLISCSHPKDIDLFVKTFVEEIEKSKMIANI